MSRKKKNRIIENVHVQDIGSEGKSIARLEGQVIFVTKALPGDVIDVKITKKKKNYLEGIPLKFHEYSDMRIEPFCKHFDICGGCKWQDLPYKEQIQYKRKQVVDNLERIGKVSPDKIHDMLPSEHTRFYRNKMEYTFSSFRWLTKEEIESSDRNLETRGVGFHIPGRWDKVVDIEKCHLQKDPSNQIRNAIRNYALEKDFSFFDLKKQEGFLRNLIIRTSTTGELMVVVIFFHEEQEQIASLMKYLKDQFPQITSLMYMINPKANDSIYDLEPLLFEGREFIYEWMEGLSFKIGPKSFYQTNSEQAYELYKIVRNFADLKGSETVYDLYTGTGTIANFLAQHAGKVIGVESVPEAIQDARENSDMNDIHNTLFYAGDMKDVFSEQFISAHGKPDVVITDPPRAGMHKNVVENLLKAAPGRIVYVSCNPATQARDIEILKEKYHVVETQPVDMFPHTYHVENVALLFLNQ